MQSCFIIGRYWFGAEEDEATERRPGHSEVAAKNKTRHFLFPGEQKCDTAAPCWDALRHQTHQDISVRFIRQRCSPKGFKIGRSSSATERELVVVSQREFDLRMQELKLCDIME